MTPPFYVLGRDSPDGPLFVEGVLLPDEYDDVLTVVWTRTISDALHLPTWNAAMSFMWSIEDWRSIPLRIE